MPCRWSTCEVERLTSWLFLAAATHHLVKDKNIRTLLEVRNDDENRRAREKWKKALQNCKEMRKLPWNPPPVTANDTPADVRHTWIRMFHAPRRRFHISTRPDSRLPYFHFRSLISVRIIESLDHFMVWACCEHFLTKNSALRGLWHRRASLETGSC
jgi:hypothetical protein